METGTVKWFNSEKASALLATKKAEKMYLFTPLQFRVMGTEVWTKVKRLLLKLNPIQRIVISFAQ